MEKFKRGDIVYVDLGQHPNSSIQSGIRPCLVVSNNINNKYSPNLCVCPFSGKLKNNPVHVRVKPRDVDGYFMKESDCLVEQIVTIDKKKVMSKIGNIPDDSAVMREINKALSLQLGINDIEKKEGK